MFGWGYVNDVCIALFKKEQEERAYREYVAECLRITTENTAKIASMIGRGETECKYISVSFDELLHPKPVEQRTADEIINNIQAEFQRLGFETK